MHLEDANQAAKCPDRQRKAVSLQYNLPPENSSIATNGRLDLGRPRVASCNIDISKTDSNLNVSHPTNLTGIATMTDSTPLSSNVGKNVNAHFDSKWNKVKKVLLPSTNFIAQPTIGSLSSELESKHLSTNLG